MIEGTQAAIGISSAGIIIKWQIFASIPGCLHDGRDSGKKAMPWKKTHGPTNLIHSGAVPRKLILLSIKNGGSVGPNLCFCKPFLWSNPPGIFRKMGKNPTIFRIRCSHDTLQMLWQKHPSDSYGLFLPWHHLKPLGSTTTLQKKNEFTKMWMARDVKVRNNPCITIAQLKKKKKKKTSDFCSTKSVGCFRWSWASTQDKIQVRYLDSQSFLTPRRPFSRSILPSPPWCRLDRRSSQPPQTKGFPKRTIIRLPYVHVGSCVC